MNKEQAAYYLPLITALAEGKTIQYYSNVDSAWNDVVSPTFSLETKYRIKQEPRVIYVNDYGHRMGTPQLSEGDAERCGSYGTLGVVKFMEVIE